MEVTPQPLAAAPPRSRPQRLARWYRRHVWPVTAALVVLVLAAGFAALQFAMRDRVAAGVRVGGVDLGGLSLDAAQARVQRQVAAAVAPVRLTYDGRTFATTLDRLGVTVDARATARAALARGRHRLADLTFWLPGGGGEAPVTVHVDAASFAAGLKTVRAAVDVPARDARLRLRGDSISVVPAKSGSGVDVAALARAVSAAVAAGRPFSGDLPMIALTPRVTTADAQSRARAAAAYVSAPITLLLRQASVTLQPREIMAMLSVNEGESAGEYPLTFDNPAARARLHRLFAAYQTAPVNASITPLLKGGVVFGQSQDGVAVDVDDLVADLNAAAVGGGSRIVHVALRDVPPQVTTTDLQSSGLAGFGSQFVTYFDPRNQARADNIALAAKLVDGTVVRPGAVFSLNQTLGPRTVNRGFDYAPVIAAGNVLRQGVGGGICQYATTLFNAVFFAGLPVVERYAHSIYISHYPIGRDATVSWGGPDFRFRNDTSRPLTIRSWTDGAALTVAIVGNTGRTVTYQTGQYYNIRRPTHTKADPRVIYDSDVPQGMTTWEKGIDGHSVKVWRTVRDASGKVLFRDTFVSNYQPMDWIERIGTGR